PKTFPPSSASCAITAIKRFRAAAAAGFLALSAPGCRRARPAAEAPTAVVLCYHTFDSPKITPFTVSSRRLEEQLRFLQVQKIPVISLPFWMRHRCDPRSLPPRSVIITIDDGYKTAKTKAWPLLKRYGFPFTVFIYPEAISRHPSALTWDDLKEMAAGVDVESHSYTPPLLTHPGRAMSPSAYRAWLDHELRDSKTDLERHLHAA